MNTNRTLLTAVAATAAVALSCAPARAQFANYGTGCGLTNSADTEPYLGMTYRLRTTGAPVASLVIAAFDLAPANLPLPFPPFCSLLLANPQALSMGFANALGEAEFALPVPISPPLANLRVYNQWFAFDLFSGMLMASDGGVATVDNPQLQILGVIAPPLVSVGSPIAITARNAGTVRPEDLCLGIMSPSGQRGLIRATAITRVGGTDIQIAGVVVTPPPDLGGHVMVMRGDGQDQATPLGNNWGWTGPALNEAGGMGQFVQGNTPPVHMPFTIQGGDVVVVLGAGTPSSGSAHMDAHWNAGSKHYDSFLAPLAYSNLNPTQLRDTIVLPNLQTTYGALYPGLLQITATTVGSDPAVRIHMVDNSACSGAGGNIWF